MVVTRDTFLQAVEEMLERLKVEDRAEDRQAAMDENALKTRKSPLMFIFI